MSMILEMPNLTASEWFAVIAATNGCGYGFDDVSKPDLLAANVAEASVDVAAHPTVDYQQLTKKLKSLSPPETMAIHVALDRYWATNSGEDHLSQLQAAVGVVIHDA